MRKLLLLFLLCSSVPAAEAQRTRTLEAIIHTLSKSTAEVQCRNKGGNLLLQMSEKEWHCYFDLKIAQKQAKKNDR